MSHDEMNITDEMCDVISTHINNYYPFGAPTSQKENSKVHSTTPVPNITETNLYTIYNNNNNTDKFLEKFGSIKPLNPNITGQVTTPISNNHLINPVIPIINQRDVKVTDISNDQTADNYRNLMREVSTEPTGDDYTHITCYNPHARWTIKPYKKQEFWIRYCDSVDITMNGRSNIHPNPYADINLCERPQDIMPIISELIFKFNKGEDLYFDDSYDQSFLAELCYVYQLVISEVFSINTETKLELCVVVLESESHWIETKDNDQFAFLEIRLQFLYAKVEASSFNRLIRPRVIQLLRNRRTLNKLSRQPVDDWEQIISPNTMNEPVVMYGSCKVRGHPKLLQTHIWSFMTEDMLNSEIIDIDLEDAFEPRNHYDVQIKAVDPLIFGGKDINYWLPLFLSLNYWNSDRLEEKITIDSSRFINLGIVQPSIEQISIDDPIERHRNHGMKFLELALSGYPEDIARAIIFIYFVNPEDVPFDYCPNDYITVLRHNMLKDITTNHYYIWDSTTRIWKLFEQKTAGSHPKTKCFNDLLTRYTDIRKELSRQIRESTDEGFKGTTEITVKKITSLLGNLKTPKHKGPIWTSVDESLAVDFYSFCNPITQELPLNDGKLHHIFTKESRLRTQDDYFTYCLNAHFDERITTIKPSNDILNSVDPEIVGSSEKLGNPHRRAWQFIYDLMSHDDEKTLFLIKRLGIFISSNLFDQSYMIWVGDANNGKSVLLRYLSWMLGECCGPAAPGVFLEGGAKESSNAHTAHLCALKGLRVAYLSETKPGAVISSANVKAITGGDEIKTREAYDKVSKTFVAFCHLILATQHLPTFKTDDEGMIKRTLVVNFQTFFCPSDSTFTNPNSILTLPEDRSLFDKVLKVPEVADAFLTMLLLAAHEYYTDKYTAIIPQQVKYALSTYAEASFAYSDFISEVCVLGPDKYINSARMHEYYSAYYNGKCDSNKVFVKRMNNKFTRKRRGVGGPYCYIGIDVDLKKLQDIIVNRKTFYLTLNVLTDAQRPIINAQINPSVASEWTNLTIAKINK